MIELHYSITEDRIVTASKRTMFDGAMLGFCIDCGGEHDNCEPDAENYPCDDCGSDRVYGAELLLLMTFA